MLHHSEWLDQCKRVPVGQSRRVYHGAEGRPNLVLYNNAGSWSCWCHSCHEGGKVNKEVLERLPETAPAIKKYLNRSALQTLESLPKAKFERLVQLLHDKRMSTVLLKQYNPLYNNEDDRLVFQFNGVNIGRDCTGRSPAKWLIYHHDHPKDFVYLQGANPWVTHEPVILTEDLFSAIKLKHYTGHSTLCCLGTNIHDSITLFLTRNLTEPATRSSTSKEQLRFVAVMGFDGDSAGFRAKRDAISRCSIRGVPTSSVDIPLGLDPKDLNPQEMLNLTSHLGDFYDLSSSCNASF